MAIVVSELKLYQSKVVSDAGTNGGRISTTLIPTGRSNDWWPNVTEAQLASGITQYRKGFLRIDNASNETAYNVRIGLWKPTPGDDELYLAKGTQTDIQSTPFSTTYYGAGQLDDTVTSGASSIDVNVADPAVILFRDGGKIRISDEPVVGGGSGNYEYATISGTPTIVGSVVTITLASALTNGYSSTNTYVSSLIEYGDLIGATSNKVVTSVAGTFDATQVVVGNIGSIYQTVTLTFSSATAFTATSDDATFSPNTGSISTTYAPTHVAVGAAYFSIPPECYGGTFTAGDTVVFVTTPPCAPVVEKRVVGAGCATFSAQTRTLMGFVGT